MFGVFFTEKFTKSQSHTQTFTRRDTNTPTTRLYQNPQCRQHAEVQRRIQYKQSIPPLPPYMLDSIAAKHSHIKRKKQRDRDLAMAKGRTVGNKERETADRWKKEGTHEERKRDERSRVKITSSSTFFKPHNKIWCRTSGPIFTPQACRDHTHAPLRRFSLSVTFLNPA